MVKSNPINEDKYFLITVDVEDWFQVENFKPWIPFSTWDHRELRVERNVHRLLDLFDSCESAGKQSSWDAGKPGGLKTSDSQNATYDKQQTVDNTHGESVNKQPPNLPTSQHPTERCPKATFFVLAWLADRLPNLVREIQSRGHEVASHGCNHQLSNQLSHKALKEELNDSRKILEDIIGDPVKGFRAPSFAISNYVMRQIAESGYLYDSSLNSFKMHNRYGTLDLSLKNKIGSAVKISNAFYELPISNLKFSKIILPIGGGAYFRVIPFPIFSRIVNLVLKTERAYLFYVHPWEFDSNQPKVNQAPSFTKFRHYHNLNKNYDHLRMLIENFRHCNFISCSQYINEIEGSV